MSSCRCWLSRCKLGRNRSDCLVSNDIHATDAFVGRSTFFWGDSTSLYLAISLEAWLRVTCTRPGAEQLPQLADAAQVMKSPHSDWHSPDHPLHFAHSRMRHGPASCAALPVRLPTDYLPLDEASARNGSTHVFWAGWAGSYTPDKTCKPLNLGVGLRAQLFIARPSVLVFNFGYHWLHATTYGTYTPTAPCVLRAWLAYEQHLSEVISLAAAANVSRVVYKTVSRSCDAGWSSSSRSRLETWRRHNLTWRLSQCALHYGKWLASPANGLSSKGLDDYCENATLNNEGVTRLNARAVAHIKQQTDHWEQTLGVRVVVFDDYAVQVRSFDPCMLMSSSSHLSRLLVA